MAIMSDKPPSSKDVPEAETFGDIDPANEARGVRLVIIHLAICLCTFLVGLDYNLIATAVPVITTEFKSTRDVGLYGAAFMVAMSATQPIAGKTYILFPKKLVYLAYLVVFEVGSLLCALASSSRMLVIGHAIAGLGASGVFAGGFAIIATIIPLHKRAMWTGLMGSTFSIASIVGPVLSGAFTQHATWRWCFYINLPIGGAAAVMFFLCVHLKPSQAEKQPLISKLKGLDILGFALLAGSITMLLLALYWGGGVDYEWSSAMVIGLFVGFGITLLLCVGWIIHQGESALIPPRLFSVNRNPALLCGAAFFVNGPFQVVIYWLPIWFQGVEGKSPMQSGISFLPTVISDVLAAIIGSAMVTSLGWWNPFLLFAEAAVCIGGGLLTTLHPGISSSRWIGYQILGGIGYSMASNLSHLAIQSSLPQDLVPLGSSTLLTIISTSCAIFMAIGQALFDRQLHANLGHLVPSSVVDSIISSGLTDIDLDITSAVMQKVTSSYSESVTQVFYITAVTPVISFLLLLGCKWISTKVRVAPERVSVREEEQVMDISSKLG